MHPALDAGDHRAAFEGEVAEVSPQESGRADALTVAARRGGGAAAELDKPVEQANRVFDRNTEERLRGWRQQRGGRQQIDRVGRVRIPLPAGHRAAGVKPAAFDPAQEREAIGGVI